MTAQILNQALLILASLAAIVVIAAHLPALAGNRATGPAGSGDPAVLLFEGEDLVDATEAAAALLPLPDADGGSLAAMIALLERRFPALGPTLDLAGDRGFTIDGLEEGERLLAERWAGFTRLTIAGGPADGGHDRLRLALLEDEVRCLRAIGEDSPQLIWKEDGTGRITWANRASLALADRVNPPAPGQVPEWPPAPLFADLPDPGDDGQATRIRRSVSLADASRPLSGPLWFDIIRIRRGTEVICFAVDATAKVAAEEARQTFVQTLARTFADLRTGLAVFDRQRRLALFNPALVDLTGLGADFLLQRPHVHSVLDRLRDMQMLPEPRNWRSWREQVAALEAEAEKGSYCENWVLPGGRTYRVSGRPHPDGALAFLFEDISDEISLSRRFRLEQETVQLLLDRLDQAIAVFSPGGTLMLCNARYAGIWGVPGGRLLDLTLGQEIARWRSASAPSPIWGQVAHLGAMDSDCREIAGTIRLGDGRALAARFACLAGGRICAEFSESARSDALSLVPGDAMAASGA
ncbi:MAG: PAS-domain containing protein [Rubellimicrobium sp.]|nr:PAS-domain containing protein [Rubellimicrobium sp.]